MILDEVKSRLSLEFHCFKFGLNNNLLIMGTIEEVIKLSIFDEIIVYIISDYPEFIPSLLRVVKIRYPEKLDKVSKLVVLQ